jgi:hypothetical protein
MAFVPLGVESGSRREVKLALLARGHRFRSGPWGAAKCSVQSF